MTIVILQGNSLSDLLIKLIKTISSLFIFSLKTSPMKFNFLPIIFLIVFSSCAFQPIQRSKNITYLEADSQQNLPEKQLNIFHQKRDKDLPVMIFIHGGSWDKGKKEIYNFLGSRMARRDVVTVIIDYPLAPDYQLPSMELASVKAVKWVYENIENYGGDKDKIFISGHSAGGHLAALAAIKKEPYEKLNFKNPLKGAILNDPAGLDQYWFLNERKDAPDGKENYNAFTADPAVWKEYSPIYFLDGNEIPILIMEGELTYPGIRLTIDRFRKRAAETGTELEYSYYEKKKHIPMITQFFWTWSKGYDDVLGFIEKN